MARKTKRQIKLDEKYVAIRDELLEQLRNQGKFGRNYDDLIDHIIYYFKLKDELQQDIEKNGIRIKVMTGNGFEKETLNDSIKNLNQVSAQLMRIMKDLGLNEPEVIDVDDEYDTL